MVNNNNENIDLRFNIDRANEIVRLYGDQTKSFIRLIISFIVSYNILFAILNINSDYVKVGGWDFWIIMSHFIFYLVISGIFVICILYSHETKGRIPSVCYYESNPYFKKDIDEKDKKDFNDNIKN